MAGVLIDNVSMGGALNEIECLIAARVPSYVLTPNVDHIVKVHHDPEFADIYSGAALVLADGMPVIWASRFLGTPLKEKVSGSDLFLYLCALAAERGYGVYFLGGRPGAAETAAQKLLALYPALRIVGYCCPPYGFHNDVSWNKKIVRLVRESCPDILFVALGAPKQEKWIRSHLEECQVPVAIGVGASLEFAAGILRRAPVWMQRSGLEWLWRLLMEPRRLWRRYLVEDPKFFWYVARQRWKRKMPITPSNRSR